MSACGPKPDQSSHEAFGAELHLAFCPPILPQARAVVSKIFSEVMAGLTYGILPTAELMPALGSLFIDLLNPPNCGLQKRSLPSLAQPEALIGERVQH
jgi:hypothetical protein